MRKMQTTINDARWIKEDGRSQQRTLFLLLHLSSALCDMLHMVHHFRALPTVSNNTLKYSRLPVRTMLFQCSVCHHGGHHACYRNYYARYPMLDLPTSFHQEPMASDDAGVSYSARQPPLSVPCVADDDSASTVSGPSTTFEVPAMESPREIQIRNKLRGHLCAAGCGHFCWAASIDIDDL